MSSEKLDVSSTSDSSTPVEKLASAYKQGLITQTQYESLVRDIELEASYSSIITTGQNILDRCLVTESWKDKHDKSGKLITKAGSITKLDPTEFPKMFNTAKPSGYILTLPDGKKVKAKFTAGGNYGCLVKVVEV